MPGTDAMSIGTGVHSGAQHNFIQKINTRVDLPTEEIVAAAVHGLESRWEAENQTANGKVIDEMVPLAKAHAKLQAPHYQPIAVEDRFSLSWFEEKYDCSIVGIFDLVTEAGEVVDFKTAKRSKSTDEADRSLQFTIYDAAFHEEHDVHPGLVMDVLVNTKTVNRQVLTTSRDKVDHEIAWNHVDTVIKSIDTGVFPPTDPTNWWCSQKYCEYARSCRFFRGAR